jgi:hypothetical protein
MDNDSIVDVLKSRGEDSSFQARRKLAERYGIFGYTGTAEQNSELLAFVVSGPPPLLSWWAWLKRIFGL